LQEKKRRKGKIFASNPFGDPTPNRLQLKLDESTVLAGSCISFSGTKKGKRNKTSAKLGFCRRSFPWPSTRSSSEGRSGQPIGAVGVFPTKSQPPASDERFKGSTRDGISPSIIPPTCKLHIFGPAAHGTAKEPLNTFGGTGGRQS